MKLAATLDWLERTHGAPRAALCAQALDTALAVAREHFGTAAGLAAALHGNDARLVVTRDGAPLDLALEPLATQLDAALGTALVTPYAARWHADAVLALFASARPWLLDAGGPLRVLRTSAHHTVARTTTGEPCTRVAAELSQHGRAVRVSLVLADRAHALGRTAALTAPSPAYQATCAKLAPVLAYANDPANPPDYLLELLLVATMRPHANDTIAAALAQTLDDALRSHASSVQVGSRSLGYSFAPTVVSRSIYRAAGALCVSMLLVPGSTCDPVRIELAPIALDDEELRSAAPDAPALAQAVTQFTQSFSAWIDETLAASLATLRDDEYQFGDLSRVTPALAAFASVTQAPLEALRHALTPSLPP